MIDIVITIFCSVLASSGFWAFLSNKKKRDNAESKMILGLGYVKIVDLCMKYIDRGYITEEEYNSLYRYLYTPYKEMGGNGTAERMMNEVKKLPIRRE